MKKITILLVLAFSASCLFAQSNDKAHFTKSKNKFYSKISKELKEFYKSKKEKKDHKSFKMDFEGMEFPTNLDDYKTQWHNPVESQARTSTCWSFSTTSFLESELYRIHGKKLKLSQIHTVYYEYIERAISFVEKRGDVYFGPGSEANAVTKIWKKYGAVPYKLYTGLINGQPYHDHGAMHKELKSYLKSVKKNNNWNVDEVVCTFKKIMNHYIGTPPAKFEWEGKEYTPKTFLSNYLKMNPEDYIDVLSYMQQPYFEEVEYEVPDNWWHDKSYHNVPLDMWINTLKRVIKEGYTVSIGGDVSEAGYDSMTEVAIVPSFDIPRENINEYSRQFRFSNGTTTDDHGIHIVGYTEYKGDMWFVIKDSGSGARNGKNVGYRFIREDYAKLKFMDFMVHKDAIPELLKKFD
ncbi:MAG: C1 family peptidase [Rhodothermaceae bacterium]